MAANKWEVLLDPDAFIPDATNHPDRGVIQNRAYLAFAGGGTTDEICYSKAFRVPDAYAAGTVTCAIAYCMDTAIANTVEFEVSVEAISDGDTHDLDAGSYFDTANPFSETVPSSDSYMSILSGTLSNKDGMAAGDLIRLKLMRDDTNDTATGDAWVFWLSLYEA